MALIKCPECGKDVSDTVQNCIHCGYVINRKENETDITVNQQDNNIISNNNLEEKKKPKSKNKIGCGIILSIFLVFAIIITVVAVSSAQNDIKMAEAQYSKKAEIINYHQILADYEANSMAARAEYSGKRYKSIGTVEHISEDYLGIYIPCTCGKSHYASINLERESEQAKTFSIRKGDIIEFEATKNGQYTASFDYGVFSVKE